MREDRNPNSQLIDAAIGSHLWAEHYDRDAVDILAVQEEIIPCRRLEQWEPSLHAAIEYRDQAEFDHLFGALRAAGLQ